MIDRSQAVEPQGSSTAARFFFIPCPGTMTYLLPYGRWGNSGWAASHGTWLEGTVVDAMAADIHPEPGEEVGLVLSHEPASKAHSVQILARRGTTLAEIWTSAELQQAYGRHSIGPPPDEWCRLQVDWPSEVHDRALLSLIDIDELAPQGPLIIEMERPIGGGCEEESGATERHYFGWVGRLIGRDEVDWSLSRIDSWLYWPTAWGPVPSELGG